MKCARSVPWLLWRRCENAQIKILHVCGMKWPYHHRYDEALCFYMLITIKLSEHGIVSLGKMKFLNVASLKLVQEGTISTFAWGTISKMTNKTCKALELMVVCRGCKCPNSSTKKWKIKKFIKWYENKILKGKKIQRPPPRKKCSGREGGTPDHFFRRGPYLCRNISHFSSGSSAPHS